MSLLPCNATLLFRDSVQDGPKEFFIFIIALVDSPSSNQHFLSVLSRRGAGAFNAAVVFFKVLFSAETWHFFLLLAKSSVLRLLLWNLKRLLIYPIENFFPPRFWLSRSVIIG